MMREVICFLSHASLRHGLTPSPITGHTLHGLDALTNLHCLHQVNPANPVIPSKTKP